MSLEEFFWNLEARKPQRVYGKGKTAMTEDEVAEIYAETYGPNS